VLLPHAREGLGGSTVSGALLAQAIGESGGWRPQVVVHGPGEPERYHRKLGLPVDSLDLDLELSSEGSRVRRAPTALRLSLAADRYLARNRPALVHVNDDLSALAWGPPARRRRIPLVWHVRQASGARAMDLLRLSMASHLVHVSHATRARFDGVRRLPPGTLVHNGLDLDEFRPPADAAPAKLALGLAPDGLAVGFVGNLLPIKRPEWAVRAWRELRGAGVESDLVVVGDDYSGGAYSVELRRLAGGDKAFHLLGRRHDIPQIMQALDVLVLPTDHPGEAFGRVVIEAMATSTAVIATAVGGVPEIVTDGTDGLLVAPSDHAGFTAALRRVLLDPALRRPSRWNALSPPARRRSSTE
jgi:glycosyltransferase involved in cell wall biosynthesis